MGVAKHGKTRRLMGTGLGLARPDPAGQVFGRLWNRTEPFLWTEPWPLAGHLDQLLTSRDSLAFSFTYEGGQYDEYR